ncbi:MAG: hypothetical protein ACLUN0_10940 [Roseburia sp.]
MKNGLNFAKKVLVTGECNVLILDEVLGTYRCRSNFVGRIRSCFKSKDG